MEKLTLREAHQLSKEPVDRLRKRVLSTGLYTHNAKGERVFPPQAAITMRQAIELLRTIGEQNAQNQ